MAAFSVKLGSFGASLGKSIWLIRLLVDRATAQILASLQSERSLKAPSQGAVLNPNVQNGHDQTCLAALEQ